MSETTETKRRGRIPKTVKEEAAKPTEEQAKLLSPKEYFEYVKSKKNSITEDELIQVYDNALTLLNKYVITGQTKGCKKILFLLDCIEAERKVVQAGYTQFVYRWDIEEYINKLSDKSIAIIEMKNYEREFPDDVVDKIIQAKEVFGDDLYVIFTDYTKKETRKIAKERREKDPILFGALVHDNTVLDRMYYICDWVDPQCDLTLDKLIANYKEKKNGSTPVRTINTPTDIDELKKQLGMIKESEKSKSSFEFESTIINTNDTPLDTNN